ncbi:glycosyltransferase [Rothia sp. P5764]|uniref:glycosyltransferase n=1 Tax=Rothia sp. P5764 TaxID=3402654 RepID=UPI003AD76CD7
MYSKDLISPLKRGYRKAVRVWEQAPEVSRDALNALEKADSFKQKKQWEKALENYRLYLMEKPDDVSANMQVAYAYLALNLPGAAYEAIRRVLLVDPSHPAAFELFLDLAERVKMDAKLRKYVVRSFSEHVTERPERWLDASDLVISLNMEVALQAFAASPDDLIRTLGKLSLLGTSKPQDQELILVAAGQKRNEALLRYNLAKGRYSVALKQLAKMEPAEIPLPPLRIAIRATHRKQKTSVAIQLVNVYLKAAPTDSWANSKKATLNTELQESKIGKERNEVLNNGYRNLQVSRLQRPVPTVERNSTGLYLLHNSLPYNSAGYATRSHGIIRGLRELGWDMRGVTRPGYPFDRPETKVDAHRVIPPLDVVDGVPYHRLTTERESVPRAPFKPYQETYTRRLVQLAKRQNVGLIHAASNYWNGISGVMAGRQLGVPSVYEVRGLWEITRISREPEWLNTDEYRFMAEMEAEAARHADVVLSLTRALKEELISRGVDGNKITIAPNGVDPERFVPREPNLQMKQQLGLGDAPTIGYVGSILDYEGIDTLLESIALLRDTGLDFNVLIVGDGSFYESALELARSLGLDDFVKFTGRVPHEDVEDYYSLIDICPLPRHGLPVCEMVSPLKPFEAMAMGKVVVGSNVDAIDEIITPGVNGLLSQKDNPHDLALQLEQLVKAPADVRELGHSSRAWVVEHRSWNSIAGIIDQAYEAAGIIE